MLTSSGPDWQRQRRTIAPFLNESISEVVWATSCRQAREMLTDIETRGDLVSNTVIVGLKIIAINVLGAAGYGIQKPCVASIAEKSETSISSSFFSSISIQAQGFILAALIPLFVLKMPFVSQALQKPAVARRDFPQYAKGMIQFERAQQAEKSVRKNSFIGMLVKELDGKDPTSESASVQNTSSLTPLEVEGNLFVFGIAGYETTANSMAFAAVNLATYPQWQDWLIEEIDVAKDNSGHTYEQTFSKLFEITRIYSPVGRTSHVVTADQYVALSSGRTHKIPSGLGIAFSNQGVNLNPSINVPDPSLFHPQRWLYDTSDTEGQFIATETGQSAKRNVPRMV
ncbi:uncharacterized protein BP5553_00892 [Venustampulla echinocandica]|uniref:Cytochrome P450 n=1 Tax=Venustampulla echinocandica TaxID=2656787 RepID=A0A370TZF2_9HELO|nr:uncharacterized protein BP5553_00892 [Venustampulla echinocandica]RDL40913.1 hypothetical protein BP5553_00892 [Venustampulla echinocandica]